ncbi:unnamed protein product, partial [Rotaria magnacalcarata]
SRIDIRLRNVNSRNHSYPVQGDPATLFAVKGKVKRITCKSHETHEI